MNRIKSKICTFALIAIVALTAGLVPIMMPSHSSGKVYAASGDPEGAVVFLVAFYGRTSQAQIDALKGGCKTMVNNLPVGETAIKVGMVGFAETAVVGSPLTGNKTSFNQGIDNLTRDSMGLLANLYEGLVTAHELLNTYTGKGPKSIVVIAQGEPNLPGSSYTTAITTAINKSNAMKNEGIVFYCAGFGGYQSAANTDFLDRFAGTSKKVYKDTAQELATFLASSSNEFIVDILQRATRLVTVTFADWNGTVLRSVSIRPGESATAPTNPTRTGYTFIGWDKTFSNVTDDLTVNARYSINNYTVRFIDWDGTLLRQQTVSYSSGAAAPSVPARIGYTFTGWDTAFNNVTQDLTVRAQYNINTFTVNFVDWDGTLLDSQIISYGSAAKAPANPQRENYYFVGWDCVFSSVTQNLTATALYEIYTYTVTFVDWNGIISETIVAHGMAAKAPDNLDHEGYTFKGWDIDFDVIIEDLTVTAQYEPNFVSATVSAYVTKLNGNKNDLTITVTELYFDGSTLTIEKTFRIDNNAAAQYSVGDYMIYIDTKGNTQIRDCRFVA